MICPKCETEMVEKMEYDSVEGIVHKYPSGIIVCLECGYYKRRNITRKRYKTMEDGGEK